MLSSTFTRQHCHSAQDLEIQVRGFPSSEPRYPHTPKNDEKAHLWHCLLIWLILWFSPVDNDLYSKYRCWHNLSPRISSRLVTIEFEKCKATIFLWRIVWVRINYDIVQTLCITRHSQKSHINSLLKSLAWLWLCSFRNQIFNIKICQLWQIFKCLHPKSLLKNKMRPKWRKFELAWTPETKFE